MNQRKREKISVTDLFHQGVPDKKDIYAVKYKHSLEQAKGNDNMDFVIKKTGIKTGKFSLKKRIINNVWVSDKPASKATRWLFKEVFKDPSRYRYSNRLIYQGGLFVFKYLNPKYRGTSVLPWFDRYPLVISLGPKVTNLGVRNIGFNLHLLPPKIRIIVICYIFEIYRNVYRYGVLFQKNNPVSINYKKIVDVLDVYGVKFCVRMYIPNRMTDIVRFPVDDWHKAIFIPSRGYEDIKAKQLIKEWKIFCKNNGYRINENVNWKSII